MLNVVHTDLWAVKLLPLCGPCVYVCVNRNYNTVEGGGGGGGGGTNSHGACSPSAWKGGGRLVADDAAVIEVTWIPRVQPKARGMI